MFSTTNTLATPGKMFSAFKKRLSLSANLFNASPSLDIKNNKIVSLESLVYLVDNYPKSIGISLTREGKLFLWDLNTLACDLKFYVSYYTPDGRFSGKFFSLRDLKLRYSYT